MRAARIIVGVAFLAAQVSFAQITVGENTQLKAGGLATFGYAGDYGNDIPSNHGLNFGMSGELTGSYYNPNFLNFSVLPYYNRSRNDSEFQSLSNASGIAGTANLFTGSNYPGTVSYHYDANNTGTFGAPGVANFTTHGNGQGFGIGWSALVPGLPTLSVGYSQGSGNATVYGSNETTTSDTKNFNLHSNYLLEGFRLSGFFDRNSYNNHFPQFLSGGQEAVSDTAGHDFGFSATHQLPFNGTFYANYTRATSTSNYDSENESKNHYTDDSVNSGVSFHPIAKLGLFFNENYTSNLNGYFSQALGTVGAIPVNFGSNSNSLTLGGGATYQLTSFIWSQGQVIHYDQHYFGQDYRATFLSGSIGMSKRLWDTLAFSATVVDNYIDRSGTNGMGFVANVNAFHRFGAWQTSGNFNYAQNVQSYLVTYTTSSYNYSANVHRRFPHHTQWTSAFNGSHSGLTQNAGDSSHAENFSTSFSMRTLSFTGNYGQSHGLSFLGINGLQPVPITPGLEGSIVFNGDSYGGGVSWTPVRRMILSASYNRGISSTFGSSFPSHNNTEVFNTQLQYHLRRIGFQAGYTKFIQGISVTGLPAANTNSFFVGLSRWFDFF
ncbi:MAG TPA: hypothetical protein VMT53_12790 [Terriglobales bacterium]|nr:hypothetical protein [Terriglobales bacterium]